MTTSATPLAWDIFMQLASAPIPLLSRKLVLEKSSTSFMGRSDASQSVRTAFRKGTASTTDNSFETRTLQMPSPVETGNPLL
ncbi:hypothetical protein McPS_25120 [Marichromatium sp. PS1]